MARPWPDGGETARRLPNAAILPHSIRQFEQSCAKLSVVLAMIRYPAIFVVCLGKRMVKGADRISQKCSVSGARWKRNRRLERQAFNYQIEILEIYLSFLALPQFG
jgi:hypothetical protein